jgi:cytochrome c oxidase assembly protein subunit 15
MTNRFQKWALAAIAVTFLVILSGALVRASDSGLGCPEWPTCYGKPYPPFSHAELLERDLPEGFNADEFHVSTAWIEYTNRFVSMILGWVVLGTLILAWRNYRQNGHVLWPTGAALVTVALNAGLGAAVVESELDPTIVTVHLLLAWVQVSLLLYAIVCAFFPEHGRPLGELPQGRKILARGALIVLAFTLTQAVFGARLRGELEVIEQDNPLMARADWIGQAGWIDYLHRSFSWTVLVGVLWLAWYAHKRVDFNQWLRFGTQITALLVLLQVGAGIGLAYIDLPPALQVIHLVTASLLVGAIVLIYLLATRLPLGTLQTATE